MNIYQVFTRLFGANVEHPVPNGSKSQNGCGTMSAFTQKALADIKAMGVEKTVITGRDCQTTYGSPSNNKSVLEFCRA